MATPLGCPKCNSTRLRSDEAAAIGYPVTITTDQAGQVEVDYTGESYEIYDEATVYAGDIWCRDCGHHMAEADLVEVD